MKVEGEFSGRGNYEVYLEVDGVVFANDLHGMATCEGKGDGVFLGEIFADLEKKTQGVAPGMNLRGVPRNLLPRVERADQKIQVRDSRALRDGTRDGRGDRIFRVNGSLLKSK